jgi:isoleucyl-tRNA synthetase
MATDVLTGQMDGVSKEWDINGEKVTLGVKKN